MRQRREWACPGAPCITITCGTVKNRNWIRSTQPPSANSSARSSWAWGPAALAPGTNRKVVADADNSNHVTVIDVTSMMMLIGIGDLLMEEDNDSDYSDGKSSPPHWFLAFLSLNLPEATLSIITMASGWSQTRRSTGCRKTPSTWPWGSSLSTRNRGQHSLTVCPFYPSPSFSFPFILLSVTFVSTFSNFPFMLCHFIGYLFSQATISFRCFLNEDLLIKFYCWWHFPLWQLPHCHCLWALLCVCHLLPFSSISYLPLFLALFIFFHDCLCFSSPILSHLITHPFNTTTWLLLVLPQCTHSMTCCKVLVPVATIVAKCFSLCCFSE